jgi:iron complex outermembrane receptor protein
VASQLLDNLTVHASYNYLHTTLLNLTAAPKNQYYLGVAWRAHSKLLIDADLRGVGGLYVADGMEYQNYALLNVKLTYTPIALLDIFATLDNLTDTHYTINRGYEMPGFTAMGGFKLRF